VKIYGIFFTTLVAKTAPISHYYIEEKISGAIATAWAVLPPPI
jgi:hypothetical protein